jgi:flagellar basal-body rod protein FlgC
MWVFETTGFAYSLAPALDRGVEGVKGSDVVEDPKTVRPSLRARPLDADAAGYVTYPNVNVMEEMASLVEASESYQANVGAISILKTMINRTLDLGN